MTEIKTPRPLVAQAADAEHLRELLAVVLDALDIPYAATVGGDEVRSKVLADRMVPTRTVLRAVVDGWATIRTQTEYLRKALAEHPARGYVTMATAEARRAAGEDFMESVRPRTPDEGAPEPEPCAASESCPCPWHDQQRGE